MRIGTWNLAGRWRNAHQALLDEASRKEILHTTTTLDLQIPTAGLGHPIPEVLSIDHIAVPAAWSVTRADQVIAIDREGKRLSDHDAYVVEVRV